MAEYLVCPEEEIADGGRKVVASGDKEIGIFRVKGALHAWHNMCPHRQGPICQGRIYPEVVEPIDENCEVRTLQYNEANMHVACPWHGWEFNLETGRNAISRYRLARAELAIREGQIYVVL